MISRSSLSDPENCHSSSSFFGESFSADADAFWADDLRFLIGELESNTLPDDLRLRRFGLGLSDAWWELSCEPDVEPDPRSTEDLLLGR